MLEREVYILLNLLVEPGWNCNRDSENKFSAFMALKRSAVRSRYPPSCKIGLELKRD